MATMRPLIRFDAQRLAEDVAERGWSLAEFARRANVADMTVYRFVNGTSQTAPIAKKLAKALGHSVRRYMISSRVAA